MKQEVQRALVAGVVLGITAGLVVWFLERFEMNRLHTDVREYLSNHDQFKEWLQERGQA